MELELVSYEVAVICAAIGLLIEFAVYFPPNSKELPPSSSADGEVIFTSFGFLLFGIGSVVAAIRLFPQSRCLASLGGLVLGLGFNALVYRLYIRIRKSLAKPSSDAQQ